MSNQTTRTEYSAEEIAAVVIAVLAVLQIQNQESGFEEAPAVSSSVRREITSTHTLSSAKKKTATNVRKNVVKVVPPSLLKEKGIAPALLPVSPAVMDAPLHPVQEKAPRSSGWYAVPSPSEEERDEMAAKRRREIAESLRPKPVAAPAVPPRLLSADQRWAEAKRAFRNLRWKQQMGFAPASTEPKKYFLLHIQHGDWEREVFHSFEARVAFMRCHGLTNDDVIFPEDHGI